MEGGRERGESGREEWKDRKKKRKVSNRPRRMEKGEGKEKWGGGRKGK